MRSPRAFLPLLLATSPPSRYSCSALLTPSSSSSSSLSSPPLRQSRRSPPVTLSSPTATATERVRRRRRRDRGHRDRRSPSSSTARAASHSEPSKTRTAREASSEARREGGRSRLLLGATSTALFAGASDSDSDYEGEEGLGHLEGIGVGIDLGTTNSAVAMMVPAEGSDDGDLSAYGKRTMPAMIEIGHEGRTIPSVVAFVPMATDIDESDGRWPFLPPWTTGTTSDDDDVRWPPTGYEIHVGERAVFHEQRRPGCAYRNVKRVVGTGGRMAGLAAGVVPNLYIESVNGNAGGDEYGFGSLDAAFDMLEDSSDKKKGKKKKKRKKEGRWKRKKAAELPKLQRQLEQARDDPALLTCDFGPLDIVDDALSSRTLLRPEQISACILRRLYDAAESYHRERMQQRQDGRSGDGGVRVTRAVIGVPAYFTEAQRQATIRASEIAGVPKVRLLPEPEAAALAYGAANPDQNNVGYSDDEELILVFDLGGGTFDVSILEVGGGVTEVLATVGNNRLGGTDFDRRVAEYLSGSAVEYSRRRNSESKALNKADTADTLEEVAVKNENKRKRGPVKDWYREGKGEVPDVILRVAEEARKRLSNQRALEVLVPLTEEGWRRVGGNGNGDIQIDTISPFDKAMLESEHGMREGDDYAIVPLNRGTFESICQNELRMLLQPIREVAIMAGVLLPGEARPSFVENALAMAAVREDADGQDFWEFENEVDDPDGNDGPPLLKTGGSVSTDSPVVKEEEETLDELAMQQIRDMDVKAQKRAQQRGRRKARDIDRRERSFRKQKQAATEEATTASLLGKRVGGSDKRRRGGSAEQQPQPTSPGAAGNERVQDGIHGRPLSRIVLVGGATRTPAIARLLEAVCGMVPQRTVHPDEAVALGCAVQAGILDGENDGLAGGMQAVLSPMQAAVMRALARKRGMDDRQMAMAERGADGEMERMMMGGGGISGMMVVDEFDDEDDFY